LVTLNNMLLKIYLTIIIGIFFWGTSIAQNVFPDEKIVRLVYSINAINANSVRDATAVNAVLAEHIKTKYEHKGEIQIVIAQNREELIRQLKEGFELTVVSTSEYLQLRKQFNLIPSFTNQTNGKVGMKFLLIVHKDEQISKISELEGKDIYMQSQENSEIEEMLLNKLLKDEKLPSSKKFFRNIIKSPATNNVVLPVFFKKVKAALVTEESLNILKEINPQLEKKLKIIYRSPSLILGLSCFNGNSNSSETKRLSEIILSLNTDSYGKQLLDLFVSEKLVPYKEEYLKDYLELFGIKK
jgi:ABC-type phosphate/phosphonate transport system substrate-binding protein